MGIKTFYDLYSDDVFSSFEQLCSKFSLHKRNFFRFLQVRDFLRKTLPQFPSLPPCNPCKALLERPPTLRGIISTLYSRISQVQCSSYLSLKGDWGSDIGDDITEELWQSILQRVHTSSICARHGLMQCKIIHRTHWTRQKMSKFFPDVSSTCNRCKLMPATHAHMFWSCVELEEFWSLIFRTISDCLDKLITPCPSIAIFGVPPDTIVLSKAEADCVAFATLLARRLILFKWKEAHPPTFTHWIRDILYFLKLEKIKHSMRGSTKTFSELWNPFLRHIKDNIQLSAVP